MSKRTKMAALPALSLFLLAVLMPSLTHAQTITPSIYWKNEVVFPDDSFFVDGDSVDAPGWVKFTILLDPYDLTVVYFQDSGRYRFHYEFATQQLDPFIGMSAAEYDQITLHEQGQQAVLGAVIIPPWGMSILDRPAEYGIQFVRQDPYPKEMIRDLFNVVKASVAADPDVEAFYFPTYEQLETAEDDRDWFESQGIPISSTGRWAQGNPIYAEGWALGLLKYFPADQIEDAYLSGDLLPSDILLTDNVPAEMPSVAGILSLSPSTPNSHVAILANAYGPPFAYLAVAEDADRAQQLVGHTIVLRAYDENNVSEVRLIDVEGVLTDEQIGEILALKILPELAISPVATCGCYSTPTDGLVLSDIQYFGGKAANFGILRTAIPDSSPVSTAFSFDVWNAFLDQPLNGGTTLREEIASRLSGYTYPPSDMAALSDELDAIRDLFKDTDVTSFTQELQNAVIATLTDPQYGFEMNKKIRFRSSTNVEDSEQFVGAGLYDSYSGCLADDLDGDDEGPCICDASKSKERGVFRAIRKVFASFYNDNAFLERLRYGVNESEVGMALLVHHSFPDEIELANGVATLQARGADDTKMLLVTQVGALSVTNPEEGSIPEEVSVSVYMSGSIRPRVVRSSNLVILGDTVLEWEDDYIELSQLLLASADEFARVTGKTAFVLDFEYKKVAPDGLLVVKQIREIPQPDTTPSITPFLINEPEEYLLLPGGRRDVFSTHRLKSRWCFGTRNCWLTPANVEEGFYGETALEYAANGRIYTVEGSLPLWPEASHRVDGADTVDGWCFPHLPNPRTYELRTFNVPTLVSQAECPVLTLRDTRRYRRPTLYLKADYTRPVLSRQGTRLTDEVTLMACARLRFGDALLQVTYEGPGGVSVTTSYYAPRTTEFAVGSFKELARSVETVIEGYTTEPIVLRGYYSQTHLVEIHIGGDELVFEPRLEPGISSETLSELRGSDIRLIHVFWDRDDGLQITTYGFGDEAHYADIDCDQAINAIDVQLAVNAALGLDTGFNCDINNDGAMNATDVQLVINAALGLW